MIKLINVTKIYAGQKEPAVRELNLTVEEGESCVLVGPSGCGKSTTLRMINRLIEPSSGTILIDGKDIRETDPDQLRMGIGYVIQQIGLLPHRTVAENIAIVPRLYGWPKDKIKERTDELLELVGLDPETTRSKYPAQLSGGQMQRVGVARAMAVDPPIMLMDEPFGAVDPIARNHLQDEFLRLQSLMRKTICFVTHDINEAIKMGDRIAIFNRGELVQHGSPHEILSNPVDEFVRDFIGYDRVVKKLSLCRVGAIARKDFGVIRESELPAAAEIMRKQQTEVSFLLDHLGAPGGMLARKLIEKQGAALSPGALKELAQKGREAFIQEDALLRDALSLLFELSVDYLGVLRGETLCGVVSLADIREYAAGKEVD
ncbi:MAG: betaine/proline/choline family ABC transporter ATP-binding protein [Dethiobacteria bacterium]